MNWLQFINVEDIQWVTVFRSVFINPFWLLAHWKYAELFAAVCTFRFCTFSIKFPDYLLVNFSIIPKKRCLMYWNELENVRSENRKRENGRKAFLKWNPELSSLHTAKMDFISQCYVHWAMNISNLKESEARIIPSLNSKPDLKGNDSLDEMM